MVTEDQINEGHKKIGALVAHIRQNFPMGCSGVMCCPDCLLDKAEKETFGRAICTMLSSIGVAAKHDPTCTISHEVDEIWSAEDAIEASGDEVGL